MKFMKYYTVSFEGIDKTGKSTLLKYLANMCNHSLVILDRGIITNIVWNKIQSREIVYDLEHWKNVLFVKLIVDKEDWEVRCKINNEPPLPQTYEEHVKAYDEVFEDFKNNSFFIIEFNTSKITPYQICKKIIKKLNELNDKGNEI